MALAVSKSARPERWQLDAADFIATVWSHHDRGYGILAARRKGSIRWRELALPVGCGTEEIIAFLQRYHRQTHDLYFCPTAFSTRERKKVYALDTPLGWVDIDEADVEAFVPQPSALWRTSSRRHQGLWVFTDYVSAMVAEDTSRTLAYRFGADRNGWSSTKLLRLPFSFNHKPHYDTPTVQLLYHNWKPLRRPRMLSSLPPRAEAVKVSVQQAAPDVAKAGEVLERYRRVLHPRPRALIRARKPYEADRSKCIFEIIAGLHDVGASSEEIAAVLWVNPHFTSKHGQSRERLQSEIGRVLGRLRVRS